VIAASFALVSAIVLPVFTVGKRGIGGYPRRVLAMGLLFLPLFASLVPVMVAWPHLPEGLVRVFALTAIWAVSCLAAYGVCFVTLGNFSVTRELLDDGMVLSEDILKVLPYAGP
jgi:hypothetical protein